MMYVKVRYEEYQIKTFGADEVATAQHISTKGDEANMTEEVVKTKDQLLAEMKVATDAGDWKAVSKISSEIAKTVASDEKAEKEAKQNALVAVTDVVKVALDKAVDKIIGTLTPDELEAMDGVWYSRDFGEQLTTCRLSKGAVRKAGGGGGGGKKFNITTNKLLEDHGSKMMGDSGKTFKKAYDDAGTDGNARYKVRMKLLKVAGLS